MLVHVTGMLVFMGATQRTPLRLSFSGGQQGLYSCIPWDRNKETILGWLQTLRHYAEKRLKHTPSLSGKETYLLVLEHQPEWQVSGLAKLDAY